MCVGTHVAQPFRSEALVCSLLVLPALSFRLLPLLCLAFLRRVGASIVPRTLNQRCVCGRAGRVRVEERGGAGAGVRRSGVSPMLQHVYSPYLLRVNQLCRTQYTDVVPTRSNGTDRTLFGERAKIGVPCYVAVRRGCKERNNRCRTPLFPAWAWASATGPYPPAPSKRWAELYAFGGRAGLGATGFKNSALIGATPFSAILEIQIVKLPISLRKRRLLLRADGCST